MKNKGFTLIELIVTIALMAALSVVVGLSITGMINNQDEKKLEHYKRRLENAACVYVETSGLTGNRNISIDDLIKKGLINKDLINPATGKTAEEEKSNTVSVTWVNNQKECKVN